MKQEVKNLKNFKGGAGCILSFNIGNDTVAIAYDSRRGIVNVQLNNTFIISNESIPQKLSEEELIQLILEKL